jgi:protein-tyrosine-phosphatase
VAAERGYDLSRHVAYQVSQADITWANEILAVDRETLEWLVAQMGPAPDRIRLYMPDGTDVPDPYEQSDEVFRASLRRIEDGARQ